MAPRDSHLDQQPLVRMLVLVNEDSKIIHPLMFLRKRGYKIKVIHRLMDTVRELTASEPDVLLLSWDLKRVDVKKVYELISQKFKCLTIVFTDDSMPKASNTLLASGIPQTIFPPISGPGLHTRIQALLNKRAKKAQKHNAKNKKLFDEPSTPPQAHLEGDLAPVERPKNVLNDDLNRVDYEKASPTDIPKMTNWTLFHSAKDPQENVWRGTSQENGHKTNFFFQGDTEPKFNGEKNQWQGFGSVDIMKTSESDQNKVMEYLSSDPSFSSKLNATNVAFVNDDLSDSSRGPVKDMADVNLEAQLLSALVDQDSKRGPKTIITDGPARKPNAPSNSGYEAITSLRVVDRKTALAQGVQKAVATISNPSDAEPNKINVLSRVTATVIKTPRNKGYLVGATASDLPDRQLMEQVLEHLNEAMRELGEPLTPISGVLELELDPLPFMLWVESKSEFFVKSRHGDNEIVYAYIPFQNMPEVVEAKDTDSLIGIKHSSLFPGKPLLFNVYIHMPKNNKYLLYFKKGSTIETNTMGKLLKFKIKHLFIKKSEVDMYQTYCAKYKIAESLDDIDTIKKKKVG